MSSQESLLPYPSNVGSPMIVPTDIVAWKTPNVHKANQEFKAKYAEIKAEFDKLILEYEWTDTVYKSIFNFEPIIGEVYHLYLNNKGQRFLSLIKPNEWSRDCLGSYRFETSRKWQKLD